MSDTTKSRIIEASGPIFAQKGYAATTVREICSAAKVNQAAINYYFGGKENLYKEVFASTISSITPWTIDIVPSSIPFEKRLRECLTLRARELFAHEMSRWKVQLTFRELRDPTPSCGERFQGLIAQDYTTLYQFLDPCYVPSTPTELRWKFAITILGSLIHYKLSDWLIPMLLAEELRTQHFKAEQIADFIVDTFLAASAPYRKTESIRSSQ